ncbi:MAG: FadR/GntR family transcriptional regulator [Conexibacter sp.]
MSTGSHDQPAVRFTQVVRGATLSEKVAADITQTIMDGALAPGERMPSERELGEQFGVSRTVIREAVRSLVASGLVEAHSGRSLRVAEVGPEAVSRAMGMFLHRSDAIDYRRVHEVRAALEIDMAGYAAERATPDDVARLRELNDKLAAVPAADVERAAELDVAFHHAVAQATGNALFRVLLEAIGPVLLEIRRRAFQSPELRRYALEAHHEILEQIAAGRAEDARAAMRAHLETAEQVWDADGEPAVAPVLKR